MRSWITAPAKEKAARRRPGRKTGRRRAFGSVGGRPYAAKGSFTSFQVGELIAMSMSRAKIGKASYP